MLNILPPKIKNRNIYNKHYNYLKITIFYMGLFLLIPTLLLIGGYFVLQNTLVENLAYNQPSLAQQNLKAMRDNIQRFNADMKKADQIQAAHINLALLTTQFTQLIPEGVSIENMELSLTQKTISFSGGAENREKLIQLQENISKSQVFTDFTYPVGSLAEKENIQFNFTGKINLNKI